MAITPENIPAPKPGIFQSKRPLEYETYAKKLRMKTLVIPAATRIHGRTSGLRRLRLTDVSYHK